MALLEELKLLLRRDSRLVSADELLKNRIVELALKLDRDLIELLMSQAKVKEYFFTEIRGVLVFDKEKFVKFVDNKEFLPDSYTSFKNKIGLYTNRAYISNSEEVVLVWPYKDCVFEGGQEEEDQKRNEIFHNEILAPDEIDLLLEPKVFASFKRINSKGEHELNELNLADNLIIKGNNLLVLKSLNKKFSGMIKLIYIDPLYNRKADTFYNDSFKHSTWLTFMKNRLEAAKSLLSDDGTIFISIDDEEQAYLKILCDEVFGRENFIACMPWKGRGGRQDAEFVADIHEFVLFYVRDKNKFIAGEMKKDDEKFPKFDSAKNMHYKFQLARKWGANSKREDRPNLFYPIKGPDGTDVYPKLSEGEEGCWRWSQKRMKQELEEGNIEFVKENGEWIPYQKIYEPIEGEQRTRKFTTWLDDVGTTADGTKELIKLFGKKVFKYPKPPLLIKRLLQIGNIKDGDYVLDFFAGSGTTAQAVLEYNEEEQVNVHFILCEQLSYIDTVTIPRVKKVIENIGSGDFVYCELKKLNEKFAQQLQKAEDSTELLELWNSMKTQAFLSFRVDPALFDDNIEEFKRLPVEKRKSILMECLEKNNLYVNYSEIKDSKYSINEKDIEFNNNFYKGDISDNIKSGL